MRIADLYATGRQVLSFEVYPPRSADGLPAVYDVVGELAGRRPGFVSITYGAGGSTRDTSLGMARDIIARFGVPVTCHLTCVGSTREQLRSWLAEASQLGVANIMALRGDPPAGQANFTPVDGGLSYAIDLVRLLREEFPGFGIGVAGYPETHQEAVSPADDLLRLKDKCEAGGEAVFTQLFFDNADFFRFAAACGDLGIDRPIVPGLLPILSFAQIRRITALCKSRLPEDLAARLEAVKDDPAAQVAIGVDHARQQTRELLDRGVPGIHFYVLNRADVMNRILDGVV